ncbi:uncharacterized protein LOC134536003 isoform X2 [Bacillus rossius redtenbacheri]|uniref:uncharacterized protein LOC134536003 isoform X2 n=1 Tax=Bacillus rossius redtenbacheri TaxID=93214 RepID=UPI002FDF05E5
MAVVHNLDITVKFLQELLAESDPGLVVTSFQVAAGASRGDNYTATLYRLRVLGELPGRRQPWRRSLIYKCLPADPARREAFKSDALFRNEVVFYTRALPALLAFQGQRDVFRAVPRCYLAQSDVIVLEDLVARGFTMADRKAGLDHVHCKAVLTELARFHALSLAMKGREPELFHGSVSGAVTEVLFVPENEQWYSEYYRTAAENAISMVEQTLPPGGTRSECLSRLRRLVSDGQFFSRMVAMVQPREPYAVLSHGDCWTNNILFKYSDAGDILEVCLVDFQISRYASPALDLAYLLYCCTSLATRRAHMPALLAHYHGTVVQALSDLGATPDRGDGQHHLRPDALWQLLLADMRRYGRYAMGAALEMIPISTCDSDQAPDLYVASRDDAGPPGQGCAPVWASNEACRRKMADLVLELVEKGDL